MKTLKFQHQGLDYTFTIVGQIQSCGQCKSIVLHFKAWSSKPTKVIEGSEMMETLPNSDNPDQIREGIQRLTLHGASIIGMDDAAIIEVTQANLDWFDFRKP